jgi:micrococcal nuclease
VYCGLVRSAGSGAQVTCRRNATSAFALPILVSVLAWGAAGSASADPCKAIADRGAMPKYLYPGATFSGPVVYIGDGDSFCVAVGQGPQKWVEVRLADFYAPELHDRDGPAAKAALSRISFGRHVVCVAEHQSHDRVVASCAVNGRSLGDLLRQAGVQESGRGW